MGKSFWGKNVKNGEDKGLHEHKIGKLPPRWCWFLDQTGQEGEKDLEGEASCASRLPARPHSKDWKPPAVPQLGIPTGRGCCRQGLCQHIMVTSFASIRPAARGREQSLALEEQIKAMTDELWHKIAASASTCVGRKENPPQLSCLGLKPTNPQFGHQHQDQVVQPSQGSGAEEQWKASAGRLGRADLPKPFISGLQLSALLLQ